MPLSYTVSIETGVVWKDHRHMIREALCMLLLLREAFILKSIHSEYAMTEFLSQTYSKGNDLFETLPSIQICVHNLEDPTFLDLEHT